MVERIESGWVLVENVKPVFDRLIKIYGTKAQVAKALGIHKQGFLHPDKKMIQRSTLNRALNLLAQHEEELSNANMPLLVVSSARLGEVLRQWSVEFLAQHERYQIGGGDSGPTQVLAQLSGYSLRVASGYINNTRPEGGEWVDAFVADRFLTAIDLDYKLRNGDLPVIPNPKLSMEVWIKRMEARGCI